jgi:exodeoxyribonuclease VII large subunit
VQVITVSQLNRYVKSLLESDRRLVSVYISGEISNFTDHYKSGHLYMTLKDENAAVKAVMFRAYASKLGFKPENGMKVIARARVSLYEKDGSFQIYIEQMQPDGIGALQLAFEQLKKKLAQEGLFDQSRKLPIPRYPSKVGVITSPTGAAVRDIFNVLGRRYPLAEIVFFPVLVQGEGAPPQLINALKWFDANNAADVIIIGRGGGSIEELWAFNDEGVARAVAACRIPVISAVGHETDFTICDFASDLRAPTPSAAAELAVPDSEQLLIHIQKLYVIARRSVRAAIESSSQRLNSLVSRRALSTPTYFIEEQYIRLDLLTRAFAQAARNRVYESINRLGAASSKLDALSPLKVLARGYSIAYVNDKVIKSTSDVFSGDRLSLRVSDGSIDCTVD